MVIVVGLGGSIPVRLPTPDSRLVWVARLVVATVSVWKPVMIGPDAVKG